MNRKPYSSYHGRRGPLRSLLLVVAALLAVVLCLALVGFFVLPNYVIYTADGPQLSLSFLRPGPADPATPAPQDPEPDVDVVIDIPSPSPSPSPTAAPDLSAYPRRDAPLGLVAVEPGAAPGRGQGAVYDMTGYRPADTGGAYTVTADAVLALPYAAAWLAPDWSQAGTGDFSRDLADRCLALAGLGFDEILLSDAPAATADLADCYTSIQTTLTRAGYTGRLGLVVNQDLFNASLPDALADAMAGFDRLYFRNSLRANVNATLKGHGWAGTVGDIVTVYGAPANTTWSWAVLPSR